MPLVNLAFRRRLIVEFDSSLLSFVHKIVELSHQPPQTNAATNLSTDRRQLIGRQLEAMKSKRQCDLIRGI